MACRGVHFALENQDVDRLLASSSDEGVLEILQEEIESKWDEDWLYESDKAWDAIHRCLSGGSLGFDSTNYPLSLAVLNGRQLYSKEDYVISLLEPKEVAEIASGLLSVDQAWLKLQYDSIDAEEYGVPKDQQDWEYTWEYFEGMVLFFQKAAHSGRHVVFSVDQ